MTSQADSVRIRWNCPAWWWLWCLTAMGALSPGGVKATGPDLGLEDISPKLPNHWHKNSTSSLYCRRGYTLQIFPNSTVRGTMDRSPINYVNLDFITVEPNTLAIRSVDTDMYLCMHHTSEVYASKNYIKKDCEWNELFLSNYYNAYQHKHHWQRRDRRRHIRKKRYILAFNTDGTTRMGNISRKSQKNAQFLRNSPKTRSTTPVGPAFSYITTKAVRSWTTPTATRLVPTPAPMSTKPPRPPKLGCKRLKTKYCKRMRRLWKSGRGIIHAKRHRKCKPRRLSNDKQTLKDRRKLLRLQRRCQRIRRKRLERRQLKANTEALKQRTSLLTHLTTRVPHR